MTVPTKLHNFTKFMMLFPAVLRNLDRKENNKDKGCSSDFYSWCGSYVIAAMLDEVTKDFPCLSF